MEDTPAAPRPKALVVAAIAAPLLLALVLAGGLAAHSMASDPVRNGRDAQATILSRSGERAVVRFPTASGRLTTTTVAICHHQSYAVGNPLMVRYDPKAPEHAAERDMLPQPNLIAPLLAMFFGVAISAAVARRFAPQAFGARSAPAAPAWDELPENSPWRPVPQPPAAEEEGEPALADATL